MITDVRRESSTSYNLLRRLTDAVCTLFRIQEFGVLCTNPPVTNSRSRVAHKTGHTLLHSKQGAFLVLEK